MVTQELGPILAKPKRGKKRSQIRSSKTESDKIKEREDSNLKKDYNETENLRADPDRPRYTKKNSEVSVDIIWRVFIIITVTSEPNELIGRETNK